MLGEKVKHKDPVPFYEKMHPYELMIYLLMASSAVLFVVLIVITLLSHSRESSYISLYFLLSTVILLFSSKYSFRIKHLFLEEKWKDIRNSVLILTLSGCAFIALQYMGWIEMKETGALHRFNDFFYILCGLHVLHIVIMVAYSGKVFRKYTKMSLDPVHAMLIQANPYEIKKIALLSQCWLYLDVIWIVILMAFIFG